MRSKILIIENEKDFAENLATLLIKSGYEVKTACNSVDGLRKISEFEPTHVLCDIFVPNPDSCVILEDLQLDNTLGCIPCILLTMPTEVNGPGKRTETGCKDYLFKPIIANTLVRAIEVRLRRYLEIKVGKIFSDKYKEKNSKVLKEDSVLFITIDNHPQFVKISQIKAISTLNQYTTLYLEKDKKAVFRKSLTTWEQILPKSAFLKISRSVIININCISKVEKWLQSSFRIFINGIDKPFEMSKRYASEIKKQI